MARGLQRTGRRIVGEGFINNGPKLEGASKPAPVVSPAPNPLDDEPTLATAQQEPQINNSPKPGNGGKPGNGSGTEKQEQTLDFSGFKAEADSLNLEKPEGTIEMQAESVPPPPPPNMDAHTEAVLDSHDAAIRQLANTMLKISETVDGLAKKVTGIGALLESIGPIMQQIAMGATGQAQGATGEAGQAGGMAGVTDPGMLAALFQNLGSRPGAAGAGGGDGKPPLGSVIADVATKAVQFMALANQLKAQQAPAQRDPTQDLLSTLNQAFNIIKSINSMQADLRNSVLQDMNLVQKAASVEKKIRPDKKEAQSEND